MPKYNCTVKAFITETYEVEEVLEIDAPDEVQAEEDALTAAEHAAALSLNTKLTAANLAYHRELSPPLKPQRSMSRALSQLVYNVRCEE